MEQLKVNRKSFADALAIGGALAGKKGILPILTYAKIQVKKSTVVIASSDSENFIKIRTKILSENNDMSFCIEPHNFGNALKSLKDDELTFEIDANSLIIRHQKGTMELAIVKSDDFPQQDKQETSKVLKMPAQLLYQWVNTAKDFVSTDSLRPVMCGMYLQKTGNELFCAATDARKMFCDTAVLENASEENFDCIIPAAAMLLLNSTFSGQDEVQIEVCNNRISFLSGDIRINCVKIEAKFPNCKAVIPQDCPINVRVDRKELMESLSRTILFAPTSTSLVVLSVVGMGMIFNCEDMDWQKKATDTCSCEHEGGDIKIGFKSSYLLDCLRSCQAEKIDLQFKDPTRPLLLLDSAFPNKRIILTPMTL